MQCRCLAIANPSPPLFPEPHRMRIEGLSERIVEASSHMAMQCAEPLAAFSMSKAPDTPICLMAWASAFF